MANGRLGKAPERWTDSLSGHISLQKLPLPLARAPLDDFREEKNALEGFYLWVVEFFPAASEAIWLPVAVAELVADGWGGGTGSPGSSRWDVALTSRSSCSRRGRSHERKLLETLFSFCAAQKGRELLPCVLLGLAA